MAGEMLKREARAQSFWKKHKIPEKARTFRQGAPKFYYLDGPPYATGFIHVGTAWNKIIKDVFIRFWRMRGFDVWDQPGYDTHGLPIEHKVENQLKLKTKGQIEKYGIGKFNKKCAEFATKFIGSMNEEFNDLGIWMDWKRPYLTLSREYIESAWATFKIAFEKGLLFRGRYPVHACPHCETAVAYNEIVYDKVSDPSIFVKFKIAGTKNEFLVIWTTTPWTLPANTGVMVHPEAEYVKAQVRGEGEKWIVARDLVETVMHKIGKADKDWKFVESMKGRDLEGLRYEHPLADILPYSEDVAKQNGYRVVLSERYVGTTEGSGLVHTAPGHGAEDYEVGKEAGLPAICYVGIDGKFTKEIPALAGMPARASNDFIIGELEKRGAMVYTEKIVHDYPRCWRCENNLLLITVPQWFFRITGMRDALLKENEKVRWTPEWAGKRFKNWLESLGDWPISRQRYWGIPLPIWVCEADTEHVRVIGAAEELGVQIEDLHRPYVDEVVLKCEGCGSKMRRVPDVLDVWFDSGLASWASLGWPKQKDLFERLWPADLNIEGPDQIRGWWNSQLITSMIAFGKAPYKSILFHGFMLDAHGAKMSKSKGNVTTPSDVMKKGFGRDALRWYMMANAVWDDYYFNWKDLEALARKLVIIDNTFNFIQSYVTRVGRAELKVEDRWLLSRLNGTVQAATEHMEAYGGHKAAEVVRDFVLDELSRTYIKLVRDRVWPAYGGDNAAFYTLYTAAKTVSRLLAPFVPFQAEDLHQRVVRPLGESVESVHLCPWPVADRELIDERLDEGMRIALRIVEGAGAVRSKSKLKLRWPLKSLVVGSEDPKVKEAVTLFNDVIRRMANVKEVAFGHADWQHEVDGAKLWLDLEMTAELKKEAAIRELVRHVQEARKGAKLIVEDRINVYVRGLSPTGFEDLIKAEVGATKIVRDKISGKTSSFEFEGQKVEVGVEVLTKGGKKV